MYSKIINFLKNAGIKVAAKNIETEKQYKLMKEMGCEYFQGYFLSSPENSISDLANAINNKTY